MKRSVAWEERLREDGCFLNESCSCLTKAAWASSVAEEFGVLEHLKLDFLGGLI